MANTTVTTANTTKLNKTFYDRQLLESAKTRFVFAKYGQKRNVPRNSGKQVEFRRWNLFDPADCMDGLTEGVTPTGQSLSQTDVTAEVNQYGAYVEVSDMLDLTGYDRVINDSVELLGEQLGTVVEWVTRDEICSGSNVQYAGGKSDRNSLTSSDKLTLTEIRKAVRTLKSAKARMFSDNGRKPHFICICSPEATFDLQSDTNWQDVSKYSNAEQIYSGEIGRMFGVVFVESTEAAVYEPAISVSVGADSTVSVINLSKPLTTRQVLFLKKGGTLSIGGNGSVAVDTTNLTAGDSSVTLTTALDAIPAENTAIISEDAGSGGSPVHATVVFGKDAYGVIGIEGSDAIESIIKPCGSAGTADPLNQRATVGAKVMAFAAKILNDLWIVRIEHTVSG